MLYNIDQHNQLAADTMPGEKRFWVRSFIVYALLEALFQVTTYCIEYSQCRKCPLPVPFYLLHYILCLLLAFMMWYLLGALSRGKFWKLAAGNLLVFLLYYFFYAAYIYVALNSKNSLLVWPEIKNVSFKRVANGSWFSIGKYVLLLAAFYILRFYTQYRKSARQRLQLAVLNKDMQLNLLKLQLNPHFYFNTLNNLYGLSRSNSMQLMPALIQLENIMQYVITECNKPAVLLKEEINFLKSYVELERLRYEEHTRIDFRVDGELDNRHIVPLLLIQFVENAFKHGMKEKLQQNWMKVHINVTGNQLCFRVENSDYSLSPSQGIGIASVRHMLNLQYEGRHQLEMRRGDSQFSVTLILDLS